MHGSAACSRGRLRGGARGSLCCRSVWVCKLLGLGLADLYHRAAINAPSINAWLPAHQQGFGVIQKMYPRGFPSATGERSRARGRADLLSSPRGTVPTAGRMCLGTARSERGQEQGDSSSRASPDTPDIPLQPDTGPAHACFQPEAGGLRLPLANPARAATSAASPLVGRSARHRVASCGIVWHGMASPCHTRACPRQQKPRSPSQPLQHTGEMWASSCNHPWLSGAGRARDQLWAG